MGSGQVVRRDNPTAMQKANPETPAVLLHDETSLFLPDSHLIP